MGDAATECHALEADLRTAVAAGDLQVAFQPIVSAKTGRITAGETLARWTHPVKGPLRPERFIDVAESCGLIDEMGKQILNMACTEAQTWTPDVRVSVNLSPSQLISGTLLLTVRSALKKSGLSAERLQVEVTEAVILRDVEGTLSQLQAVRDLGVQILIDEYGAGYSSLSYFQRCCFDQIKIDASFVSAIDGSRVNRAIVQAIVRLGKELDIEVVGKGVETEEQMRTLIALGCTQMQGFLFGRPCTPSSFRTRLATPLRTWMFAATAA